MKTTGPIGLNNYLIPNPMAPRTRFDVTLNERLARDFQEIADQEGVSRAEVFKRAIAAYKILKQEENEGAQIVIKKSGEIDRQLVAL